MPWYWPSAPSWSGEWSSNSSAETPTWRSTSPSRSKVLRQKPHTALADAAEAKSTGAPQFGQAARQARWAFGFGLGWPPGGPGGGCGGAAMLRV
jgi:hypothetical protein